jgi:octaprenyl-diphosphate synthase
MFGDILYSRAFCELSQMDKKISYIISNAVTLLSIGEILDVQLSKTFNTSYKKYLDMIDKKTASLIEASAKAASILAQKDENAFGLYGKNLGLAFQMVDDILDITQDSQTLGKPALHDFVEGKVTIPYLLLYKKLEDKQSLVKLYKKPLNDEESNWIKIKMKETNALNESIKLAKDIANEALEAIKSEQNEDLVMIMKAMTEREF